MTASPLLEVAGLTVDFAGDGAPVRALHGIDLALAAGETYALVGESGSGKSVTSLAIMGLLDRGAAVGGSIRLCKREGAPVELRGLSAAAMTRLRGREVAMVFQEPMTSLNPVATAGAQVAEVLRRHRGVRGAALEKAVVAALAEVEIPDPAARARAYPHELSGGMRQRVLIALALAGNPRLLIADEPTTALDVTVQAQILALLQRLQAQRGMAILFITHSLAVVATIAHRVGVMYAGRIVEEAPVATLFARPRHPYTRGLLASVPVANAGSAARARLRAIPGSPVDARDPPPGCAFGPRCTLAVPPCAAGGVPLALVAAAQASRCHRWAEL